MTISLQAWLMIVIPELFFFFIWMSICFSSMELKVERKKKKSNVVELRKENYPFEQGEPVQYDPYLY